MDNKTKAMHRGNLATHLDDVRADLVHMLSYWEAADLPPDLLTNDEFPFDMALEDLIANVQAAVERIRFANDFLEMEPVVMTVSREEYEWLLAKLDEPPRVLPKLKALLEKHKPE